MKVVSAKGGLWHPFTIVYAFFVQVLGANAGRAPDDSRSVGKQEELCRFQSKVVEFSPFVDKTCCSFCAKVRYELTIAEQP